MGGLGKRALVAVLGAGFVTIVAAVQWQLWRGGLGVPLTYGSDASFYHFVTKSIADNGWFYTNPQVGAPFQQVLHDYPLNTDNLNFLALRVLAFASDNPFVIDNLFALLTFPAVFAASWFALHRLRFSSVTAYAAAIVYTLAPYHFARGDVHLMLAAYYSVPLGCLLLYEIIEGRGAADAGFEAEPGTSVRQRLRRLLVSRWLWIPVLLGSTGAYYGVFFSYLALTIGIAVAIGSRDPRRLVMPLFCVALTLGVLLANNLPTFIYRYQHGPNHEAVNRRLGENDTLGIQFAYLVLPIENHRIPAFADFKEKLSDSVSPVRDSEQQGLGVLAATGLLVSFGSLLVAGIGSGRGEYWTRRRRESGALNVLAVLLATVGGLSTIVGMLGFLDLRAYARMSIFIAFFSLVALASLFESWRARHVSDGWARASIAGLVVVCLLAAFEQTSVRPVHRRAAEAAMRSDRAFVHEIERRLGEDGRVFVLPLLDFPEVSVTTDRLYTSNELAKPTLYSNSLRWSWGAMKGRPENLTPSLANRPLESLLPDLDALGFDGIYLDRTLFLDDGKEIETRLEMLLGAQPLVSGNGTKSFFDLRPYERQLPPPTQAAREAALHPLRLEWDRGFQLVDGPGQFYPQLDGATSGRWSRRNATLEIENGLSSTRRLSLHAEAHLDGTTGTLEVRVGRERRVFDLTGEPTPITIELDIPPGTTTVSFRSVSAKPAPAPATGRSPGDFRLNDVWWEAPLV